MAERSTIHSGNWAYVSTEPTVEPSTPNAHLSLSRAKQRADEKLAELEATHGVPLPAKERRVFLNTMTQRYLKAKGKASARVKRASEKKKLDAVAKKLEWERTNGYQSAKRAKDLHKPSGAAVPFPISQMPEDTADDFLGFLTGKVKPIVDKFRSWLRSTDDGIDPRTRAYMELPPEVIERSERAIKWINEFNQKVGASKTSLPLYPLLLLLPYGADVAGLIWLIKKYRANRNSKKVFNRMLGVDKSTLRNKGDPGPYTFNVVEGRFVKSKPNRFKVPTRLDEANPLLKAEDGNDKRLYLALDGLERMTDDQAVDRSIMRVVRRFLDFSKMQRDASLAEVSAEAFEYKKSKKPNSLSLSRSRTAIEEEFIRFLVGLDPADSLYTTTTVQSPTEYTVKKVGDSYDVDYKEYERRFDLKDVTKFVKKFLGPEDQTQSDYQFRLFLMKLYKKTATALFYVNAIPGPKHVLSQKIANVKTEKPLFFYPLKWEYFESKGVEDVFVDPFDDTLSYTPDEGEDTGEAEALSEEEEIALALEDPDLYMTDWRWSDDIEDPRVTRLRQIQAEGQADFWGPDSEDDEDYSKRKLPKVVPLLFGCDEFYRRSRSVDKCDSKLNSFRELDIPTAITNKDFDYFLRELDYKQPRFYDRLEAKVKRYSEYDFYVGFIFDRYRRKLDSHFEALRRMPTINVVKKESYIRIISVIRNNLVDLKKLEDAGKSGLEVSVYYRLIFKDIEALRKFREEFRKALEAEIAVLRSEGKTKWDTGTKLELIKGKTLEEDRWLLNFSERYYRDFKKTLTNYSYKHTINDKGTITVDLKNESTKRKKTISDYVKVLYGKGYSVVDSDDVITVYNRRDILDALDKLKKQGYGVYKRIEGNDYNYYITFDDIYEVTDSSSAT